jgi:multidrug transporter EmrE-like cation transporter
MAIGIAIGTVGQTLMKYFAIRTPLVFDWTLPVQLLTNLPLLLVFGWYFVGAIVWLFILQKLPLSLAYPTLALNYLSVGAVSILIFHEPFSLGKAFAYGLVIVGIVLLYRFS